MNPIIRELLIEEPIKLSPEGQQAVISAYDIAVKNGFVGTELEWLQTLQFIQSPITAEVLAAAQAAAASAFASGASEQVALEKAAEMIQLAQAVLALRNQAESLASASGSFATDSGISATASEVARVASVAAQGIATTQAQNSIISAGQSAESAAAAAASSALITNKAEVNIPTAGNILRANGTLFESISEVELLRSKQIFRRSPLSAETDTAQIIHWDTSLGKPNQNPYTNSDSGATYQRLSGTGNFQLFNGKLSATNLLDFFGIATGGVGSIKFTAWVRLQPLQRNTRLFISKDANNYILYGISASSLITVEVVINSVSTIVYSVNISILTAAGALTAAENIDVCGDISISLFQGSINQPYTSLSLYVHSTVFTSLRLTLDLSAYLSTFSKKSDIAFCGFNGISSGNPISSWTIKSISP
jgi:hypothetical protein